MSTKNDHFWNIPNKNTFEVNTIDRTLYYLLSYNKSESKESAIRMRSDEILRVEAMNILIEKLGIVDAARFISIIKRDNFDYTKWQRNLFPNKSIDEIYKMATDYEEELNKN